MADIIELLREDEAQLRKMVGQAGLAGPETGVRVKNPAFLLADLSTATTEIESLRSRAEKAEAERDSARETIRINSVWDFPKDIQDLNVRLEAAEATCEKLAAALQDSTELINRLMHVHVAPDECTSFVKPSSQWFWDNGGTIACIAEQTANNRQAISEYRKEASNAD